MEVGLNAALFVKGASEDRRRKGRSDGISIKILLVIFGVLIIIGLSPAWAQSGDSELKSNAPPETIWVGAIGSGFCKGTLQAGGSLGAGFGTEVFGSTVSHDLALASANFGWVFTGVMVPDRWYRGNLELVAELFGGMQIHPNDRYFVGLTPLIRYNFATGSRWIPFFNVGAGVSATNIEGPDLNGTFQFNLQGGAGTHYFLSDRTALTVQYRWLHFSDAGITYPNHGTNTQLYLAGVSWFF